MRPRTPHEDVLFVIQRKGPLTVCGLRQMIERLQEKSGIYARVTTHKLRSCFAKLYIESGGDSHSLA